MCACGWGRLRGERQTLRVARPTPNTRKHAGRQAHLGHADGLRALAWEEERKVRLVVRELRVRRRLRGSHIYIKLCGGGGRRKARVAGWGAGRGRGKRARLPRAPRAQLTTAKSRGRACTVQAMDHAAPCA